MNPGILDFALATSAAFCAFALLATAIRALHSAQRLRYRYALYSSRDKLFRLAAQGVLDPKGEAFRLTVAGANVMLHLNDQLGVSMYRLVEDLVDAGELDERNQRLLGQLGHLEREALEEVRTEIGEITLNLMRHNSRLVRLFFWARMNGVEQNGGPNGEANERGFVVNDFVRAAKGRSAVAA